MLADLPAAREPAVLEQFDRGAEQEPVLSRTAGRGPGDGFDQTTSGRGDQRERALEPGPGDALATVPLIATC